MTDIISTGEEWKYGRGLSLGEAQDIMGRRLPDIERDTAVGRVAAPAWLRQKIEAKKHVMLAKYYAHACGQTTAMYAVVGHVLKPASDTVLTAMQYKAAILTALRAGCAVWEFVSPHGKIIDISPHGNFRPEKRGAKRLCLEDFI